MADKLYLPHLLVLFLAPLLVKWRWGVTAAFVVGFLELAAVPLVFYLMSVYHLFPDPYAGEPVPEHPLARIKRGQAAGTLLLLFYGAVPAVAAAGGCAVAALWSIAAALRRIVANRG